MSELFDRTYSLNLNGRLVTNLHIDFDITHTRSSEPNSAAISVYNLSEDSRTGLSDAQNPVIELEAGYDGENSLLFKGKARRVVSSREGVDWVTTLECGDGEAEIRQSNIQISFPRGIAIEDVVEQLARHVGINAGNLKSAIKRKGFAAAFTEFARGASFSGSAHRIITRLSKSLGLNVSIQDEQYSVYEIDGGTVQGQSFSLSSETGMIGAPESGDNGTLRVRSLLLPTIRPGHRVFVDSENLKAFYRVKTARHTGSWRGAEWFTDLELAPL